jgi:hypothetical protein
VPIDADTKLVPCWKVGRRDAESGIAFITAVEEAFDSDIDYGMVVKIYGVTEDDTNKRYSPAKCIGSEKVVIAGNPDMNSFPHPMLNARTSQ